MRPWTIWDDMIQSLEKENQKLKAQLEVALMYLGADMSDRALEKVLKKIEEINNSTNKENK